MDLIEIILKDEIKIYQYEELSEAVDFLKTLHSPYVFDLHGVLDTISSNTTIPVNKSASCCSYVGSRGTMRDEARLEIKERIISEQIEFGVLVFKRHEEQRNDIGTCQSPTCGTKAWYCLLVGCEVFCDDSFDHINAVKSYGIKTLHITKQQPFLKSLGVKK